MINKLVEEEGKQPAAGGMATAQQKIEKQARQLAYDTRYQVKKEVGDKKVNPASMKRLLLQRLQKSTAAPNVKVRAKQMLLGEDYIGDIGDFAADTVANAMFKVFVESKKVEVQEEIQLEYLKELDENPDRKYKVRVTDKKTGNSYVRYATREKITQLRTNPNIQSVEMTEYGEPREGERKSGESTAQALGGGKKAKQDYDRDGTIESGAKEHAGAVHNAIQRKRGLPADGKDTSGVKEEFIADAAGINADQDANTKKITGLKVGESNKIVVFPNDSTTDRQGTGAATPRSVYAHTELEGEVIAETGYQKFLNMLQEKAESEQQQKLFGLALSVKRGETPRSEVSAEVLKIVDTMSEKKIRDFAKTKHEGLPKKKVAEEVESEMGEKPKTDKGQKCEDDMRSLPTKMNLVKNKLRSMGLKMSYEPEGEVIDERRREDRGKTRPPRDRAMEIMRTKPDYRQGGATRSGKTIAQHEAERGVKKTPGAPTPTGETTADRLAVKKQRQAAEVAAKQRAREEEDRKRRLA